MKKYDARISIDFLPSSNQYCDAFGLSLIVKRPLYVMLSSVIISITALKISKIKVSPIIKSHLEFLQAKTLPYTRWGMLVLKMIGVKSTLSSLKAFGGCSGIKSWVWEFPLQLKIFWSAPCLYPDTILVVSEKINFFISTCDLSSS